MYVLCMYVYKYNLIVYDNRIRWCTCRVENILTLGKLLSLWFCFLLHSILFLISQTSYRTYKIISSYELARPVMGTIFLVISREISIEHPSVGLASLAQFILLKLSFYLHRFISKYHHDLCNKYHK